MAAGDAIVYSLDVLEDLTTAQKLDLRDWVISLNVGNPSDIQAISIVRQSNDKIQVVVKTYSDKPFANCTADELGRLVGRR